MYCIQLLLYLPSITCRMYLVSQFYQLLEQLLDISAMDGYPLAGLSV